MNELLESIRSVGIKVPITVYRDASRYIILDGERRWRCASRLNLREIPAIVQPKPSPLENLLMMFNIHKVRVDWDYLPTAFKLREVQQMLEDEGKPSSPRDIAGLTGLSAQAVRRHLELLELPEKYISMLKDEMLKPRGQQRIKVDLFIEIFKSLRVVRRYLPETIDKFSDELYVDALVDKYRAGVIDNVTAFREISKIARAELTGANRKPSVDAIVRLVDDARYSIEQAYMDTVELAYQQRDLVGKVQALTVRLEDSPRAVGRNTELKLLLRSLRSTIDRLLGE